jgi:hypothetical protein
MCDEPDIVMQSLSLSKAMESAKESKKLKKKKKAEKRRKRRRSMKEQRKCASWNGNKHVTRRRN